MRILITFLALLSLSYAEPMTDVQLQELLAKNTYFVKNGTAGLVRYKTKSYLVSNWHVCRGFEDNETVAINEFYSTNGVVRVIATFPKKDLCILEAPEYRGLEIGATRYYGDAVYTSGYPGSSRNRLVFSKGFVRNTEKASLEFGVPEKCPSGFALSGKSCKYTFMLQDTTCKGEGGVSGSPMIDSEGKLVGVVSSTNGKNSSVLFIQELIEILKLLNP